MSNVKCQIFGIWHTKYQKITHIRYSKCQNIWHEWIVKSQIWKCTDRNCKIFMIFLFHFLSHLLVRSPLFFSKNAPTLSPLIFSSLTKSASCHWSLSWSGFYFCFCFFCYDLMGGFRWWCVSSNGVG